MHHLAFLQHPCHMAPGQRTRGKNNFDLITSEHHFFYRRNTNIIGASLGCAIFVALIVAIWWCVNKRRKERIRELYTPRPFLAYSHARSQRATAGLRPGSDIMHRFAALEQRSSGGHTGPSSGDAVVEGTRTSSKRARERWPEQSSRLAPENAIEVPAYPPPIAVASGWFGVRTFSGSMLEIPPPYDQNYFRL